MEKSAGAEKAGPENLDGALLFTRRPTGVVFIYRAKRAD
jgi:hypothetical protein